MKFRLFMVLVFAVVVTAQAEIKQELGIDQSVDYKALESLGPWDDRNYQLTSEDLAYLPENDQYIANVPLFYKVGVRKKHPEIGDHYPRSLYQTFLIQFGGLVVDGVWYKEGLGRYYHPVDLEGKPDPAVRGGLVDPSAEVIFAQGAETAIEYNPTNNLVAVAGVNAGGGQSMFYTDDGGATWNFSQVNTNSCCDPTVDWSFDGSRVYQADLGDCGSGLFDLCQIRASYSTDQGQTWAPMITIDPDVTNDKEYIHVDRGAASPFRDNVYITYHKNNVMHFAKSTDMGVTWTTPQALTQGVDTGIGSDITTDSAGNIYYIYPSVDGAGLISLKSSDGGDNWDAPVQISPIRGDFDFPIPSMETREVFIYASADVDSSDNIYVAITDETADSTGGGTGTAANNRGEIRVFKSTDAGATWNELVKPHADDGQLNSGNPIDRFHPWLMVGENDAIHIGFYDTRHSVNRTGVDFYYNVSVDGGTSWIPAGEQRFSTATSSNLTDNFEWGDYNGLSVVMDKVIMTWTDNRAAQKNAIAGFTDNAFGEPTFTISANPNQISVCANDTNNEVQLDLTAIDNYPGIITLSEDTTPGYLTNGAFSANNSAAPFSSTYSFDVDGSGTPGSETLTIAASGNDGGDIIDRSIDVTVNYSSTAPGASTLMMPADGAVDVLLSPTLTWSADANANSYLVEIATDNAFTSVVDSATVNDTMYTVGITLERDTEYFWRVTTSGQCGPGSASAVSSFTTNNLLCFVSGASIPDNNPAGIDAVGNVSDTGTLSGLTVSLAAQHTWVGDLIVTLEHEGTTVTLMDRPGAPASTNGCSSNNVDTLFDDAASTPVEGVCDPDPLAIGGTVIPQEALAGFNGTDLSGDWTLNISDNVGQDTGTLTEFCLFPVLGPSDVIFENGFE